MSERSLTRTFYDFPGESSRSAATTRGRRPPVSGRGYGGRMTMRVVAYRRPLPSSDPASLEDFELPVPEPGPQPDPPGPGRGGVGEPRRREDAAASDLAGSPGCSASTPQAWSPPSAARWACSPWATRSTTPGPRARPQRRPVPAGQRADRRAQAAHADLRPGRGAAADQHHRVGDAVRRFRLARELARCWSCRGGRRRSMVVQLARALTGLTVICTAPAPITAWALDLGAHDVVNHHDLCPPCGRSRRTASTTCSPRTPPG